MKLNGWINKFYIVYKIVIKSCNLMVFMFYRYIFNVILYRHDIFMSGEKEELEIKIFYNESNSKWKNFS